MNALSQAAAAFQFLRPWWLLALLALPLLAWGWRRWQRRRDAWRDVVDPHLRAHLLVEVGAGSRRGTGLAPWLALLALALGITALAGPSWRSSELPLWRTQMPLVIALDLSQPMLADDLPPSRLLQARARIAELLRLRKDGQLGLVAYAGDAYTVAPLTDDVANVALFLDALVPEVMPDFGADLAHGDAGRAITHSRRLLQRAGFAEGRIVLLTAGADASARREAAAAAADGLQVSVLGLGSAAGGQYPRASGGSGNTRLQAEPLRALAAAGGGRYVQAASGAEDLRALQLLQPVGEAASAGNAGGSGTRLLALDQGFWLLPPLLLLLLWLFRRGGLLAPLAVVLLLQLPMPQAHAQAPATVPQAASAPTTTSGGLWRRGDQQLHALQRRAEDAYRQGDYAQAAQLFALDPGARGQYNLGNALAKQGRYQEALDAYDRALQAQPDMADAIENRRIVAAAQRQQPPTGGRQPQGDQRRPGQANATGSGEQGGQDAGSGPPESANPSAPRSPATSNTGSPQEPTPAQAPQPSDAQQQAQADAAQRERMQRALQQADGRQQGEDVDAHAGETALERERRIVNEAQLRRISDDPGGLLRAKFRLEQQRRQGGGRP